MLRMAREQIVKMVVPPPATRASARRTASPGPGWMAPTPGSLASPALAPFPDASRPAPLSRWQIPTQHAAEAVSPKIEPLMVRTGATARISSDRLLQSKGRFRSIASPPAQTASLAIR